MRREHVAALGAVAALALLTGGCASAPTPTVEPIPATRSTVDVRPTGLAIPAIGVRETTLVPLHLGAAHELLPPQDFARAGWYAEGPAPGEPGPSVIAGHVDSHTGPAVFFRLRELRPGDPVTVSRADGSSVLFTVDSVRQYAKDAFPTDTVYGPVPGAALRLITCGGDFDRSTRSYRDDVVVFASEHGGGWADGVVVS